MKPKLSAADVGKHTMSDEFDSLDAIGKAAVEAAVNRCRALAAQIESKLRNKHERFVDKLSLADFYASLECAANVLGQKKVGRVNRKHPKATQGAHRVSVPTC